MNIVLPYVSYEHFKKYNNKNTEWILSLISFSRLGQHSRKELDSLRQYHNIILNFDILLCESDFQTSIRKFNELNLSDDMVIRVQDTGVLEYLLEHTQNPIQFICETGNINRQGLEAWVKYIGNRLDRLILSIQASSLQLKEMLKNINCDCEILGFGPILLFYSPRKLLSPLEFDIDDNVIEKLAQSEESSHKDFPVIENYHGTFMFYNKWHCLIDHCEQLQNLGINYLRIDLAREIGHLDLILDIIKNFDDDKFLKLKNEFPQKLIKSFFRSNKSDVLFKKLKNQRRAKDDIDYFGEITAVEKPDLLIFENRSQKIINPESEIRILTPEGKEYTRKVFEISDLMGNGITDFSVPIERGMISYMSGIIPKSVIFLNHSL